MKTVPTDMKGFWTWAFNIIEKIKSSLSFDMIVEQNVLSLETITPTIFLLIMICGMSLGTKGLFISIGLAYLFLPVGIGFSFFNTGAGKFFALFFLILYLLFLITSLIYIFVFNNEIPSSWEDASTFLSKIVFLSSYPIAFSFRLVQGYFRVIIRGENPIDDMIKETFSPSLKFTLVFGIVIFLITVPPNINGSLPAFFILLLIMIAIVVLIIFIVGLLSTGNNFDPFFKIYLFYLDIIYSPIIDLLIRSSKAPVRLHWTIYLFVVIFAIIIPILVKILQTHSLYKASKKLTDEEYEELAEGETIFGSQSDGFKRNYYWWPITDTCCRIVYSFLSGYEITIGAIIVMALLSIAISVLRPHSSWSSFIIALGETIVLVIVNIIGLALEKGKKISPGLMAFLIFCTFIPVFVSIFIFIRYELAKNYEKACEEEQENQKLKKEIGFFRYYLNHFLNTEKKNLKYSDRVLDEKNIPDDQLTKEEYILRENFRVTQRILSFIFSLVPFSFFLFYLTFKSLLSGLTLD